MNLLSFGPWKPDAPNLANPSNAELPLLTCKNAIWRDGSYRAFYPLAAISAALGSACLGAISCYDSTGAVQIFAGTATALYKLNGTTWTDVSKVGGYTATKWSFQTFGNCLNASDYTDAMQTINITSGTQFADLDVSGTDLVPKCHVLGVIRDFLFAGNTNDATNGVVPYRVQWSALNNDASWPIPATVAASAAQAGAQTLYEEYGAVQAIGDGESFGLIFQQSGISRASYIGGNVVFEFQTFEKRRGAVGQNAVCRVGNQFYFMSTTGFCVTNGAECEDLGAGAFDNWFFTNVKTSAIQNTCVVADTVAKCVYVLFQSSGGSGLDSLLIYNYKDNRATYCLQSADLIFPLLVNNGWVVGGFDSTHKYGQFTGTQGTATFTTLYTQLTPGRRSLVTNLRPLCDKTVTAAAGAVGNLSDTAPTFTYASANSLSGMVPVRIEGRYHELSVQSTAAFTGMIGVGVEVSGASRI